MKTSEYRSGIWTNIITQTLINSHAESDRVALCLSPQPFKIGANVNTFYVYIAIRGSTRFSTIPIVRLEQIPEPLNLTLKELQDIENRWLIFSKSLVFEQKTNHFRELTHQKSYPLLISNRPQ